MMTGTSHLMSPLHAKLREKQKSTPCEKISSQIKFSSQEVTFPSYLDPNNWHVVHFEDGLSAVPPQL